MPPLNLLIKPASSNCNLRCKYCVCHLLAENRSTSSYRITEISTLEMLVKKALEYADNTCTFAFQGGESTLAGLDFFKKLIEYENKYNIKNVNIHTIAKEKQQLNNCFYFALCLNLLSVPR